jgi:NADH:ubiquinone oxidoreductase subunit 5 (subunit L)/multisubunit Na+/H+ antiporter MnhA subunit
MSKVSLLYHRADGFYDHAMWFRLFNAAVVHLILHGFYKAYLFLSAGEEIGLSKPQAP